MLFNSWIFLGFMPLVFLLYWLVFNKTIRLQNGFLTFASFVFYGWWSIRFLQLLFLSLLVDFSVGLLLENAKKQCLRKLLITFSIFFNIGLLCFFKYFNFFADSLKEFLLLFGMKPDFVTLDILLPVGISFYTFQSLSYTIQVYRGKMRATKDIIAYAAYISFFPQLVAGPIEKATHFLPQFQTKRRFNYQQASQGMKLILWGYFKKVVIADTCAFYADMTFNNIHNFSGQDLIMGAIYFSFQIYCDFSGYTDIARGLAKLLGFELIVNFRYPYFSRNIVEFWRRWHISLSTWFRDYLFIPLGGSYSTLAVTIRNIFVVFLISGLWHGANVTFIVWGLLHAFYYLSLLLFNKTTSTLKEIIADKRTFPSINELTSMLFTFMLVTIAWVFFRAHTVGEAFDYLQGMLNITGFSLIGKRDALILVLVLLAIEWLGRHNTSALEELIGRVPRWRYLIYIVIGLLILTNFSKEASFIYFQF